MKKIFLIIFISVFSYVSNAQLKTQDVFTKNEMVWYGLDFSKAKFIGNVEHAKGLRPVNAFDLVNKYIPAWNELIVIEPYNFNLRSAFCKNYIYYDLKPVELVNSKISTDNLKTINSNLISKDALSEIISAYQFGDRKEGLGVVFVIESFDKPMMQATLWVVCFDIATKKILLSEYCVGKPVGFGLRNYWAGSIKHIINSIRFVKFEKWRRESSRN